MTRILLLGKDGQVGWELQRSLAVLGPVQATGRAAVDITRSDELRALIRSVAPTVIVNAAAYTNVVQAESEPELAYAANAAAPAVMAEESRRLGAWLVHLSTDYVFGDEGTKPMDEKTEPLPLNVYGRTKLEGENAVRDSRCMYLIFRSSWIYGLHGDNFVRTVLRGAAEGGRLEVVDDQYGAPTGADLVADVVAHALRHAMRHPEDSGLYHLAASSFTNWFQYAERLITRAHRLGMISYTPDQVLCPVRTGARPERVDRPRNSRLCTDKLRHTFGLHLPVWHEGVDRFVETLANDGRSSLQEGSIL